MGKIIGDEPCPECRKNGRDSTGNHLMVFEDGGGYCNRCGYTRSPWIEYERGSQKPSELLSKESNGMPLEEVQKLPIAALKARGIDKDICERYGVRVEYETTTGQERGYYYPITKGGKLVSYRVRGLPKRFSNVGDSIRGRRVDLLGQHTCQKGGKKLLICGGQDDMLSACQMLWRKYPNFPPNVVSLTNGENVKSVADNLGFVNSYEEVLIHTDMDDVGRKCAEDIAKLIGPKAKLVETSEKDANDMLLKGKQAEFINAFFSAKPWRPKELITVEDAWEDATLLPEFGRPWPWPTLTKLTYGRRDGQGIYVGAGVKVGKTEWLSEMVHHIINVENSPVFLAKFEQGAGETLRAIAGKKDKLPYNNPEAVEDGRVTQEKLNTAIDSLKGKVYLFNAGYSDAGQGDLWDRMKPTIRYLVLNEGVKDIFIDPITQLTDGMDPSATETYLRKFSNEIQALSQELGFFYYIFCHLKEPNTGKTHEEGGKVKSAQFRGSRAMQEKTKFMLGIRRNINAEDEEERNKSIFDLLLASVGKAGNFEVVYNPETTGYLEPEKQFTISGDY